MSRAGRLLGRPRRRSGGQADLATKWYTVGAEHRTTFYGQLSAHELGKDAPPQPMPEPRPTAAEQARFEAQELVRAARLFLAAGDRARAMNFLMAMADQAKQLIDFAMLARACRIVWPGRSGDRGGAARAGGRHAAAGAWLSDHDRAGRRAAPPSAR